MYSQSSVVGKACDACCLYRLLSELVDVRSRSSVVGKASDACCLYRLLSELVDVRSRSSVVGKACVMHVVCTD